MVTAITTALGDVISWVGTVVTALTDTENGALAPLLPVFAIGIAVSVCLFGIRIIRGFTYGA